MSITTNAWTHPTTGETRHYINFEEWAPAAGITKEKGSYTFPKAQFVPSKEISRANLRALKGFKVWADENGKITVDYFINFYNFDVEDAAEFAQKLEEAFAQQGGLDFLATTEEPAEPTAEEIEIEKLKAQAKEVAATHEEGADHLLTKAENLQKRIDDRKVIFPEDGLCSEDKKEVETAQRIFMAQYQEELNIPTLWEAFDWIEEEYRTPMDRRGPKYIKKSTDYAIAAYAKTVSPNPALVDWVDYEAKAINEAVWAIEHWEEAEVGYWRGRRVLISAEFYEGYWEIDAQALAPTGADTWVNPTPVSVTLAPGFDARQVVCELVASAMLAA